MSTFVGIDFGTCNIKVMYKKNNKTKELRLHNDMSIDGGDVPNVILYDKKKSNGAIQHIVGRNAIKRRDFNNTVFFIKKKLQNADWKGYIDNLDRNVSALDVATDIFRVIKESVTSRLRNEELDVAITMPVCYTELQKQRIYDAAQSAGIDVKAVLSESFAAAFSQGDILKHGNVIFVFDFGGATLDISMVRVKKEIDKLIIEEIASCGLNYGGTDIDEALFDFFENKYPADMREIEQCDSCYKTNIINMISELKEQLFTNDEDEVEDSHSAPNGKFYTFVLTKDDVNYVLEKSGIKNRIITMLNEMFDQLDDVIKEDVTHVRLFGGSSYITFFQKILTEYFGKEIFDYDDFNPNDFDDDSRIRTAVASGAARYMSMQETQNVSIVNRIPFHIGIKQNEYYKRIVDRNRVWGDETTGWITITPEQIIKNNYSIFIYQSFANVGNKPLWDDLEKEHSIIYMGKVIY